MRLWLLPNPGGFQAYMITFPKDQDLRTVMDIIGPLRVGMFIHKVPTLRHILLDAAVYRDKKPYTSSGTLLTHEELDGIAKKLDLGRWNFYGAVYGREPVRTVFNREDAESKAKAHWLIKTLIKEYAENRWGEDRMHLELMDQIAETYFFNNRALMKWNERVKDALDPKGVLAPGKNGFWPKG